MIYVLYGKLEIPRVSILLLDKNIFPDYTEVFGLFFHFKYFARVCEIYWHPLFSFFWSFNSSSLSYENVIPSSGRRLWKSNCSLPKFIEEMKNHITASLKNLDEKNIRNEQIKWELLKYEMRKLSKNFSKQILFESNKDRKALEKRF